MVAVLTQITRELLNQVCVCAQLIMQEPREPSIALVVLSFESREVFHSRIQHPDPESGAWCTEAQ